MIRQIASILIAFSFMPIMAKKKMSTGPMMLISGTILGFLAGFSPLKVLENFTTLFTTPSTVKTISVVVMVGILGGILKHYDVLESIVVKLKEIISSQKAIMMSLPAVIGMLSVPGGAQLSAPFVKSIGKDLETPDDIVTVVNVSFRHIAMFLLPTSLVFLQAIAPEINIYSLIGLNIGFVILTQLTAYMLYLRKYKDVKNKTVPKKWASIGKLVVYLAPIYMAVVLNGVFKIEMYISVALCIVLSFFMFGTKSLKEFCTVGYKSISVSTFCMMLGVFYIQNTVKDLDAIMLGFVDMFNHTSGFAMLLVIAGATILFGLTTGLNMVPVGIVLPMVLSLPISESEKLVYTFFVFAWGFLGYFFSPLHLCNLLTLKEVGCTSGPMYKQYAKIAPFLAAYSFVLFYVYRFLLVK